MSCEAVWWPVVGLFAIAATIVVNFTIPQFDDNGSTDTTLNPAGWAFSIWGVIYIWQPLWVIYSFGISIKSSNKVLFITRSFWIWWLLSCVSNVTWCIFERLDYDLPQDSNNTDYILATGIVFFALNFTLYGAMFESHKYIMHEVPLARQYMESSDIMKQYPSTFSNSAGDGLRASRILVLNGLALYSGWCTIAFFVNWAIILVRRFKFSNDAATLISGGAAAAVLLIYFLCDLVVFRSYLKKTYTFYIPLIVAFVGILTRWGIDFEDTPSSILVVATLMVTIALFVVKIALGLFGCGGNALKQV